MQGAGRVQLSSVTAFFPCYNDAGSIEWVVRRAAEALDSAGVAHDIVVVNDGSSDDSAAVLERLANEIPQLSVVHHEVNRGYGGALRSGFAAATGDWVFYTDGDGQYDPADLERVFALPQCEDDIDLVQCFKIERGDGVVRRIVGRLYHHTVALFFRLPVRDTDCDFRVMRRTVLDKCTLTRNSGAICVELVSELVDQGARFVEVGVNHYPRRAGVSTFFRPVPVARALLELAQLWFAVRARRRH